MDRHTSLSWIWWPFGGLVGGTGCLSCWKKVDNGECTALGMLPETHEEAHAMAAQSGPVTVKGVVDCLWLALTHSHTCLAKRPLRLQAIRSLHAIEYTPTRVPKAHLIPPLPPPNIPRPWALWQQ